MRLLAMLVAALSVSLAGPVAVRAAPSTATETILYTFQGGNDGAAPHGELLADSAGNLYGTTTAGGDAAACQGGCGTVFKLTPAGNGTYTETVLHAFQGGSDGAAPQSGLVEDGSGTLYGTTFSGGTGGCPGGCGTVFAITAGGTESVIHAFQGGVDGAAPYCTLILAPDGSLYGVTIAGGLKTVMSNGTVAGFGTFFQLTHSGGVWTNTVRHNFESTLQTQQPVQIIAAPQGIFYGVTVRQQFFSGPVAQDGVFLVNPSNPRGEFWSTRTLLYGESNQLTNFFGRPILDSDDCLIGTTESGGSVNNGNVFGTVYRLCPTKGTGGRGLWTVTIIYAFQRDIDNVSDAEDPESGVIADAAGDLFGTTRYGGRHHSRFAAGTVYELVKTGPKHYRESILWSFQGQLLGDGAQPYGGLIADAAGNLYGTTASGGTTNFGTVFKITP